LSSPTISSSKGITTNAYKTAEYVKTPFDMNEITQAKGIVYAAKYFRSFTLQIYKIVHPFYNMFGPYIFAEKF
jgi:hypothetical protein